MYTHPHTCAYLILLTYTQAYSDMIHDIVSQESAKSAVAIEPSASVALEDMLEDVMTAMFTHVRRIM
jgi:hypothetical protein